MIIQIYHGIKKTIKRFKRFFFAYFYVPIYKPAHMAATYKKGRLNIKLVYFTPYFFMAYSYTLKKPVLKTRSKIALLNLIHNKASDLLELSHVDAVGSLSAAEWLQMAATIKKEF